MDSAPHQNAVLAALVRSRAETLDAPPSCLPLDMLVDVTGLDRRQISNAVVGLIARDLVERKERGCYQLKENWETAVADGAPLTSGPRGPMARTRPMANSLRQRLWQAMRMTGKFTLADLLPLACTGQERDAEGNAQRYLRALVRAGYLHTFRKRADDGKPCSNGLLRYSLIRNSGPDAPFLSKGRHVYDRNTGTQYLLAGTAGEGGAP